MGFLKRNALLVFLALLCSSCYATVPLGYSDPYHGYYDPYYYTYPRSYYSSPRLDFFFYSYPGRKDFGHYRKGFGHYGRKGFGHYGRKGFGHRGFYGRGYGKGFHR
ncbi:MAG: hypothetical protein EHM36_11610 [Deltaproteobacteria bacterium]|nr:MAG: hypothetical protein EHM36_11610 [Deltaproteobacteria bacterium]